MRTPLKSVINLLYLTSISLITRVQFLSSYVISALNVKHGVFSSDYIGIETVVSLMRPFFTGLYDQTERRNVVVNTPASFGRFRV